MDLCRFGISHVSPENPNHSFRGRFGGFAAVDDVISDEFVVRTFIFLGLALADHFLGRIVECRPGPLFKAEKRG
jgi:hypothetical protein